MSIPELYNYITENQKRLLVTYELKNTKLIIDGQSMHNQLFHKMKRFYSNYNNNLESVYKSYSKYVKNFFNKLINHNTDILVVFNGGWETENEENIVKVLRRNIKSLLQLQASNERTFFNFYQVFSSKDDLYYLTLKYEVLINVLEELNIKFLMCIFKSGNVIATMAKILNCPVLAADSDFYLYGNDYIVFSAEDFDTRYNTSSKKIMCNIFRPDEFVKEYPGLNSLCLALLPILLDENYILYDVLSEFLKMKSADKKMHNFHNKFETVFNWLRGHTLQSAANETLSMMISIGMAPELSKNLIEESVNKCSAMSTYMLHHLTHQSSFSIDEKMILEAKNKFFKFKFDATNVLGEEINGNNVNYNYIMQDDDEMKKKFNISVPDWFINDYLKGRYNPYIINLIEHQTYIPCCQWEDFNYPSIEETSVPLILLIYSLVMTCSNEEVKPLKLYIRENIDVCCKELDVRKYPFKLEDIRNADVTIRLNVINRALGIEDATNFQDLPKKWRLFVVTAIFWMKQEGEPVKNKFHLHALLLALLSTVIEEKIRGSRDYDFFGESFYKEVEEISNNNNNNKVELGNDKELSIIQALVEISYDDAVESARDFFPIFRCPDFSSRCNKNVALGKLSNLTIHIYQQFRYCLTHTKNINALLDCPYYQPIISEIFNGSMTYNLFMDISEQSMKNDNYIADKLKNISSIFKVFNLITEKADLLLK